MKLAKFAAALGAITLTTLAGPALAAPPYQVDVGVHASGDHPFTATTVSGVSWSVAGPSGRVDWDCVPSDAAGLIHAGPIAVGLIATSSDTTWTKCSGPLGLGLTMEQRGDLSVNAGGTATNAVTDSIDGTVTSYDIYVYATNAEADCNFSVTGTVRSQFDEATQRLAIDETGYTGNLTVSGITYGVNDCFGLMSDGNAVDFAAVYDIDSPDGDINIKP